MAISAPVSDTSRATQHEPDQSWPRALGIRAEWPNGMVSYIPISGAQFFGLEQFGAPLSGDAIIGMIKNMIHSGQPSLLPPVRKKKNAKRKKPVKRSR